MKKINDIAYNNKNDLTIYFNDELVANKTIIYFHGGGIESGDKCDSYIESFIEQFVKSDCAFVSVNYSLYPETKFPTFINDCAEAIKFIFDNADKYGLSKNIYVGGSSAGAYITLMLMCNEKYLKDVGVDSSKIMGWISDDGQTTDHFNIQKYELGIDPWEQRITEKSPIFYVNSNTKFTKLLCIYYDNDMPMRKEQNLLFVSTIKHFNSSADITLRELEGTHCQGTSCPEKDGTYRFVNEVLSWF